MEVPVAHVAMRGRMDLSAARQVVRLATDGDGHGVEWLATLPGVSVTTEREDYASGKMTEIKRWYSESSNPDRLQGGPNEVIDDCEQVALARFWSFWGDTDFADVPLWSLAPGGAAVSLLRRTAVAWHHWRQVYRMVRTLPGHDGG
mgnify:CR=1 FL=1